MKKVISKLAIMLTVILLVACSNDSSSEVAESPQMTLSDYQGVWQSIKNDTIFISISASGYISFFLKDRVLGYGGAYMDNNNIIVQNELTNRQDKIIVSEIQLNKIKVHAQIYDAINQMAYYPFEGDFILTNESIVSFAGEKWCPYYWEETLSQIWGRGKSQYQMLISGSNSAVLYKYSTPQNTITNKHEMYCVQRLFKNSVKFVYGMIQDDRFGQFAIFSFDGMYIKNNKNLRF